jgi:hypothetical protein
MILGYSDNKLIFFKCVFLNLTKRGIVFNQQRSNAFLCLVQNNEYNAFWMKVG